MSKPFSRIRAINRLKSNPFYVAGFYNSLHPVSDDLLKDTYSGHLQSERSHVPYGQTTCKQSSHLQVGRAQAEHSQAGYALSKKPQIGNVSLFDTGKRSHGVGDRGAESCHG